MVFGVPFDCGEQRAGSPRNELRPLRRGVRPDALGKLEEANLPPVFLGNGLTQG